MASTNFFNDILIAHQNEQPFVMFRYPGSDHLKGYIQLDDDLCTNDIDNRSGFVFAPFDQNSDRLIFERNHCQIITAHYINKTDNKQKTQFREGDHARIAHEDLVKKGIEYIQKAKLEKVVLSRKIEKKIDHLDFISLFRKLLNYKHAFVYCWYHPKVGMWLGASPETLIAIKALSFATMAVAGTRKENIDINKTWGEKERHEQNLVTRFLKNQLEHYQLNISKPYTINAGNVSHLRTDLKGKLKMGYKLSDLLNKIHPTPAVCGAPMEDARQFILNFENYDRSFYSGYLGEVNIDGFTQLHVNLRCMQFHRKMAHVYVGGGITRDSNPHEEWLETMLKSRMMLQYL